MRPITETESKLLDEYLSILKPISLALDILQGQHDVSAGYLLPTLINVIEEWRSVELADLEFCSGVLCSMMGDLKRRFEDELESDYFKIAAALHPKFRLYWVVADKTDNVKSVVRNALKKFQREIVAKNSTAATANVEKGSFFWRFEQRAVEVQRDGIDTLYNVWEQWCCATGSSILPPDLNNAFIHYNTTLPSSAAVERLFSLSKRVLSPLRNRLEDSTFEWMVMLPSASEIKV